MRIDVEKKAQVYSFDAAADEKLLFAGLRAGIPLPYECATGTCGTCRARLKQGELDQGWSAAPGRAHLKTEKNEFLLCQAIAGSACTVGVNARIRPFREDDLRPDYHCGTASKWTRLTPDVMQFDVALRRDVTFHAGQFFILQAPNVPGYRAYSMVNFEPQTDRLEFIIKRKPGGRFSDWVFDPARSHDSVDLFGPLGRATFHPDEGRDLFMIAGGSGIAGLMSILERACQCNYLQSHTATLFFGIRTRQDVFYAHRLARLQQQFADNLSVNIVLSDETPDSPPPALPDAINIQYGLVHEAALRALPSTAPPNTLIYVAGPQPMVDGSIRSLVMESHAAPQMIRYDKFN